MLPVSQDQNTMPVPCCLTHRASCIWATFVTTPLTMWWRDSCACKAITYSCRWAGMRLVCRQRMQRFRIRCHQLNGPTTTLLIWKSKWRRWVWQLIGRVKLLLAVLITIVGINGSFWRCLKRVLLIARLKWWTGIQSIKRYWLMSRWLMDAVGAQVP